MKERLITLVCALGALALFVVMFVKREGAISARDDVPRPTTAERRGNGYHAALTWLDAEGIRGISLRDRFDSLAKREDLPPTGNLLIVTLPATVDFRTAEFLPLDRWVRAGNTLLVMASLSDNPDWAFAFGGFAWGDLNLLTGLEFETVTTRQARLARGARAAPGSTAVERRPDAENLLRAFAEPRRMTMVSSRPHAYFDGVRSVVSLSDYPQRIWTVKVPYEGFVLALGRESESGEGVLWTRPLGKGRIIVSGFGSLFTNRALGLADNARLLANIVGANVSNEGAVLFDDAHQGLGAAYDPDKFYTDRRLYVTIGVVVALWFVWVLGATRLRAPLARSSTPREAELIRAAGAFLSRALPAHAAARRLLDNFFKRVVARAGERRGDAWDVLSHHARIAPGDLDQLRSWHAAALGGRRVPLQDLQNLIVRLDRQLAT